MTKRRIALIVPTVILAILPSAAQAAHRTHHIELIIQDSTITKLGVKQTTAGLVSGAPFGHSVESIAETVTGATSTSVSLRGTITIYTTHGTVSGTVGFKVTPAAAGGATGAGRGKISGGTARYKGAHGSFAFTGSEAANSSVFVIHATGKVSY